MKVAVIVDEQNKDVKQALVSIGVSCKLRGRISSNKKDLLFSLKMSYPTNTEKARVGGSTVVTYHPDIDKFPVERILVDDEISNHIGQNMYILDTDLEHDSCVYYLGI